MENSKMSQRLKLSALVIALTAAACSNAPTNVVSPSGNVIEVASFNLGDGVTPEVFASIDRAVEAEHVSKQPGFVSREAGFTENGQWVAIVHWESIADAEASMASFGTAAAAADFMSQIDGNSLVMTRYKRRRP